MTTTAHPTTLVTGGAGFIGSHLVDALVARGDRVRVLDDLSSGNLDNLANVGNQIELIEGDLRDPAICRLACTNVGVVFHQAARGSVPRSMEDPATTFAVNLGGTANLLAAARDAGVERVVWASSSSVYGDSVALPKREGEEGRPLSPYALSKRQCEELAELFTRCFGLATVGLRYFNVYGPRQDPRGPYAAVVPRFFAAASTSDPIEIHGDGIQTRDFTWVGDAVAANLAAAAAPLAACGRAYNIAHGERTSVLDLAHHILAATGSTSRIVHLERRAGDVDHSCAEVSLAAGALGVRCGTNLAAGLALTFDPGAT
jgi:nucleoside-diphosphate-sugar epimerase